MNKKEIGKELRSRVDGRRTMEATKRKPLSGGEIDTLVAMFKHRHLGAGGVPSKAGMSDLVDRGWIEASPKQKHGLRTLNGAGKLAALFMWPMPLVWFRLVRRWGFKRAFCGQEVYDP